jgi:hypothetical protein
MMVAVVRHAPCMLTGTDASAHARARIPTTITYSQVARMRKHVRGAYRWQRRAQQQVTSSVGAVAAATLLWNAAVQCSERTADSERPAEAALIQTEEEQLKVSATTSGHTTAADF